MATYDAALEILTVIRAHPSDGDPILENAEAEGFFSLDLAADQVGRLGMVTGSQKLAQQILIALTERRMFALLASFNIQEFETLAHQRLLQFRANQLRFASENSPGLVGFDVTRFDPLKKRYVTLTPSPVPDSFVDTKVVPGVTYSYQVGRRSSGSAKSVVVETLSITVPLAGSDLLLDFESCTVEVERSAVTFYFPQNRTFRQDEILGSVIAVNARPGSDPRAVVLVIRATTGAGAPLIVRVPLSPTF